MKKGIVFRDYQNEAVDKAVWCIDKFDNNSLIVLPTGAGKSLVIGGIADRLRREILILQPSKEILEQNMKKLAMYVPENEIGVYSASFKRKDIKKYNFATIQSIYKVPELFKHIELVLVDECFSGETEVLTDRGFVRFDALDRTEKIAQWEDGNISFVTPTRHVKREHKGEMGFLEIGRGRTMPITMGHNQPLVNKTTKALVTKPISQCSFHFNWDLLVSGKSTEDSEVLTPLERMYIATQADGSVYKIRKDAVVISFSFSKDRKIDRIKRLAEEANIKFYEVKGRRGSGNVKPRRRFMAIMPSGTTKDIRNHIAYPMSYEKATQVIEEMVQWDGHQRDADNYYYSSTDKTQADFYYQVAIIAGHACYQSVQTDNRKDTYNTMHRLFIRKNLSRRSTQCLKLKSGNYNGKVYCVEVPSHKIIIRHEGVSFITGNCHQVNPKNSKGMFTSFLKEIGNPVTIGLTASPFRNVTGYANVGGIVTSGTVLKLINRMNPRMWNRIAYNVNNHELVERGYLCPLKYISRTFVPHANIPLNKSRSDFNLEAFETLLTPYEEQIMISINGARKHRKAVLVFCASVAQAERLASTMTKAACVSGKTPIDERDKIIEDFRTGEIQVVFNVGVLTTGFDFPELDCIYLIRPTRSLGLYYQMLGRGVRLAKGKENCIVLDYSGSFDQLGRVEDIKLVKERLWELYANGEKAHGREIFSWSA